MLVLHLAIHSPETKSESPVKLQMIMVSIKVPVRDQALLDGSLVFAAAAAMGADDPDSLEKTPRATF